MVHADVAARPCVERRNDGPDCLVARNLRLYTHLPAQDESVRKLPEFIVTALIDL